MALERGVEWRWAAVRLLLLFGASRLLLAACAAAVELFVAVQVTAGGGATLRATARPILASLTSWDSVYYLEIARAGYHAGPINGPYPDVSFFPLFPLLVRLVAVPLGGDVALAGVLVANLAFLAALPVVYAFVRARLGPAPALLAAALVTLQPGAVAFGMAYSDSLFLLLTVAALLAAQRGRRGIAGGLGALAALTRLPGVLLCLPLLIVFLGEDGRREDGRRFRPSWLWSLAPVLGLVAFFAYVGAVTGDPLAPLRAQAVWDPGQVPDAVPPLQDLLAVGLVYGAGALVYGAVALVEGRLLVDRWRGRRDPAGVAWVLANLAVIVASRRVASLPRYLAPLVQLPEQAAGGGYPTRAVQAILAGSVAGFVVLGLLHFSLLLAP